jgi:hypothetical protein
MLFLAFLLLMAFLLSLAFLLLLACPLSVAFMLLLAFTAIADFPAVANVHLLLASMLLLALLLTLKSLVSLLSLDFFQWLASAVAGVHGIADYLFLLSFLCFCWFRAKVGDRSDRSIFRYRFDIRLNRSIQSLDFKFHFYMYLPIVSDHFRFRFFNQPIWGGSSF